MRSVHLAVFGLLTACGGVEQADLFELRDSGRNRLEQLSAPQKISFATYNVENLWDSIEGNTSEVYAEYSDKSSNWLSANMYAVKAKQVAEALRVSGAPDIVALQEIESGRNGSQALEILKVELKGMGYAHYALGQQMADNETSVTTAVVSKFPILANESLNFPGDASARDPQVVTLDIKGAKLRLYNSHWKSKRGGPQVPTEPMRMAIAKLIKADVDAARVKEPLLDIIVTGDFNSEYNETQLRNAGPTGIVEGLAATGDERMMLSSQPSTRLYNLWFELPEANRCSYSFDGKRDCIDNILVTDTLYDNSGLQIVDNSLRIVGFSGKHAEEKKLLNADGTPFRWQYKQYKKGNVQFTEHTGRGYSDHLPIVFDISVMPHLAQPKKLNIAKPSTTEFGPATKNKDNVPVCSQQSDKFYDLNQDSFYEENALSRCFQLTAAKYQIYKASSQNIAVKIQNQELLVVLTRSYGENKDAMKKLKSYEGRNLSGIVGRVGWYGGRLAIFANSLAEVEASN